MVVNVVYPIEVDKYVTLAPGSYHMSMTRAEYLLLIGDNGCNYRFPPEKAWQIYFKLSPKKSY